MNEYLIMSNNASTLGIGIPDYIRRKVTGRALPRTKVLPENRKLFVELSRIGNNINQLTKLAHLGINDPINLISHLEELKNELDLLKSKIISNDSRSD